ncbi:MAG: DUF4194 domain-containing protein [Clostridia bacterium]
MEIRDIEYSKALVALLKGSVERESQAKLWETVDNNKNAIDDYVSKLGLNLFINELDGYAYLKQIDEEESEIPVLIPKRKIKYLDSLLIVIFRKTLLDFDSGSGEGRCILSKNQIVDRVKVFLADTTNEVKQNNDISASLNHICEYGFIRKTKSSEESYEVLRIIRSFVDAEWLSKLDEKLEEYKNYKAGEES